MQHIAGAGKLKVFHSCRNWLDEFRIFARDENGKIMNEQKFHLMASTRYLFLGPMGRLDSEARTSNTVQAISCANSLELRAK